jgi:predicted phage-related endonuclease
MGKPQGQGSEGGEGGMTFTVINAPQRSPEWFAARLGRLTGSRAGDMLATIKSGEAAARRDLRTQLVCERLTGTVQEEPFINAAMQRGIDCEPLAFAAYEAHTGQVVERTGFLAHTDLMAGCSLDGHIGDFVGLIECKCPKSATHLKYLRGKVAPIEYAPQITHNLWITGAEWCDFVSFDDRFPPELSLFVARVNRADVDLKAYELAARLFLSEVDKEVDTLRGLARAAA